MAKKKEATEEVAKVDLSKKAAPEDNITKVNLDKPIENETKDSQRVPSHENFMRLLQISISIT